MYIYLYTGLADPAPLIQSLYMDIECSSKLRLDSVITVVDSKHFMNHCNTKNINKSAHGGISEAIIQVSFADRILINKIDLISDEILKVIIDKIKSINSIATIIKCKHSNVDIEELLNIKAFDPVKCKALVDEKIQNEKTS